MRTQKRTSNSVWIILGALVIISASFSTRAQAEGYRRGEDRRIEERRIEEERRRHWEEERRLAEERRLHPVAVYVPAPVVVAPPPPSPGISLVIPISFH